MCVSQKEPLSPNPVQTPRCARLFPSVACWTLPVTCYLDLLPRLPVGRPLPRRHGAHPADTREDLPTPPEYTCHAGLSQPPGPQTCAAWRPRKTNQPHVRRDPGSPQVPRARAPGPPGRRRQHPGFQDSCCSELTEGEQGRCRQSGESETQTLRPPGASWPSAGWVLHLGRTVGETVCVQNSQHGDARVRGVWRGSREQGRPESATSRPAGSPAHL